MDSAFLWSWSLAFFQDSTESRMFAAKFIILLQPGAGCFLVWVLFSPSLFLAETNYLLCVFPLAEVEGKFSVWYVTWGAQERSVQWAAGRRKKLEICSQAALSADWKLRFGGCGGNQRRLTAEVDQEHLLFWLNGYTLFGSTLTAEGLRVFILFSRWANSIIKNTRCWKYFWCAILQWEFSTMSLDRVGIKINLCYIIT